jgi:DNA polymerase-3 subunit epsilon
MEREIALDTETTGLDPEQGHRIVEIGCVELSGRVRTGRSFHRYLNPDRDMPEEAFRVHGLSAAFLSDKQRFAEICAELLEFIGDSNLVIHNAGFDMKFINYELRKLKKPAIDFSRAVDTVGIARKKFPGSPASLDALCRRFEIDLSARTKHGALLDAELLSEVYLELMGGRQVTLDLNASNAAAQQGAAAEAAARTTLPAREFPLSPEEAAAHLLLVAKLKDPVWKLFLPGTAT